MTNETKKPHKGQRLVIIGGVAGGASCAARARRLDETSEILLLQVCARYYVCTLFL
jgi:NADPH-dependent 2,4-dienoyl-CoA reductase/sulfur reductase-like enzyme